MIIQTVGDMNHRYRLGHLWVPEMVLNVQSDSCNNGKITQGPE